MENKSLLFQPVKFMAEKCFQPNAGKKVEAYGVITDYIRGGYWAVKYSFADGEFCESRIHASELTLCEGDEIQTAIESAQGWARMLGTFENLRKRLFYYLSKDDEMSMDAVRTKMIDKMHIECLK